MLDSTNGYDTYKQLVNWAKKVRPNHSLMERGKRTMYEFSDGVQFLLAFLVIIGGGALLMFKVLREPTPKEPTPGTDAQNAN